MSARLIASGLLSVAIAMPATASALNADPTGASTAAEPEATSFELAKTGSELQSILLGPLPDAEGSSTGHLTLFVVNPTKTTKKLAIEYLQSSGSRSNPLAVATAGPATVVGARRVNLPSGRPTPVRLNFELAKGRTASWLAGELLLSASGPKPSKYPAGSLVVPVKAEFKPLGELTFNPSPLAVQVTRWLPGGAPKTKVELDGAGASALLQQAPTFSTSLLLGNGNGSHVSATFGELKETEGRIFGTLSLGDDAPPGEYTGSMVFGAGAGAPQLSLIVKSHVFVGWFIFFVLVSSLLGGLLPTVTRAGRRRSQLRLTLRNTIKRYEAAGKEGQLVAGVP